MSTKVIKLGFLGLNVRKLSEMKHHYGTILGLPVAEDAGRETYLSCGPEHHAVSFHQGDGKGYRHVGFEIDGEGPLDDALAALKAQGIPATIQSDPFAGIGSAIQIADPDGYALYLYREAAPSKIPHGQNGGIVPDKLGHVALRVGDARITAKYFTDVLGFRWSDWCEDFFVFMRCNADHHTMNFLNSPHRGMFHVAFELHDWAHMGRACDILGLHKVPIAWGPGRHGMGHNLFTYHYDPDGNTVELIADLDRMSDERLGYFDPRPYHQDNPQRPKIWPRAPETANMWGVMPPVGFEDTPVGAD